MKTEIEKLNLEAIDDKIIAKAAAIIRAVGSCYGDHHYGTAWRIWNGSDIPKASAP